jgi:hypothetical protein
VLKSTIALERFAACSVHSKPGRSPREAKVFHRIQQYPLVHYGGGTYRPRVYGEPQPDGSWGGWIVFFPLEGSRAVATDRETTQSTFESLGV